MDRSIIVLESFDKTRSNLVLDGLIISNPRRKNIRKWLDELHAPYTLIVMPENGNYDEWVKALGYQSTIDRI